MVVQYSLSIRNKPAYHHKFSSASLSRAIKRAQRSRAGQQFQQSLQQSNNPNIKLVAMANHTQLTEGEIAVFKEVFYRLDADGDGKISAKDLEVHTRSLGLELTEANLKVYIQWCKIKSCNMIW